MARGVKVGDGYVEIRTEVDNASIAAAETTMRNRIKKFNESVDKDLHTMGGSYFPSLPKDSEIQKELKRQTDVQKSITKMVNDETKVRDNFARASRERANVQILKDLDNQFKSARSVYNQKIKVDVDVDKSHLQQRTRELQQAVEGSLSLLPSRLENVFTRGGPYGAAVFAAVAAIAFPFVQGILAGIGGAIVAGAGLGIIAGGVALIFKEPIVEQAINEFKETVGKGLQNAAQSFIVPVLDSITILKTGFAQFVPFIAQAFANLGPSLKTISGGFAEALPILGRTLEQISRIAQPFIQILADKLPQISAALERFFQKMQVAQPGLQAGFTFILNIVISVIEVVGDLIAQGGILFAVFTKALAGIAEGFAQIFDILGKIPVIGEPFQDAANKLHDMNNQLNDSLAVFPTFTGVVATNASTTQGLADANKEAAKAADEHRKAIEELWKELDKNHDALISNSEASESVTAAWAAAREQLDGNTDGFDVNTPAALKNRDAVEAVAENYRDQFLAAIREGKIPLEEATKRYDDQVTQLIDLAKKHGATADQVDELVHRYGFVPKDVRTILTLQGVEDVDSAMLSLLVKQGALRDGISPDQANKKVQQYYSNLQRGNRKAEGGPIYGPGTETSDSVPAMLSAGEHVITAKEVRAAGGHKAVAAMRAALLGKIQSFAFGGQVQSTSQVANQPYRVENWPWPIDVSKTKTNYPVFAMGEMGNWPSGPPGYGGMPYADSGVWKKVVALIESTPWAHTNGAAFNNAYRPGDPLWHGGGRAVDWGGFNQDKLAQFFMNMRPKVLELIHSSDTANYGISRGQVHEMGAKLWSEHKNHVHIAMDDGGYLQPGWNPPIYNGTGQLEPVVPLDRFGELTSGGGGGDFEVHVYFDSVLVDERVRTVVKDNNNNIVRAAKRRVG